MTTVTVLVPALNAAPTVAHAVTAARAQLGPGDEVVVVDDGSSDDTAAVAEAAGARVVRLPENRGVGAARNAGAAGAVGHLLLFTDADATLGPGVVDAVRAGLSAPDAPAALVGVYAARCDATDLVSRFKNLWIRYTYLRAGPDVDFLFGCLCALPRDRFEALGGFDPSFHRDTGGVDIELGLRMTARGLRVRLDPALEVVHGRTFTLLELLRNDHRRARGYAALGLRRRGLVDLARRPRFANIPPSYLAGTALVGLGALLVAATPWFPPLWLAALWVAFAHTRLHRDLYGFLAAEGDVRVALAAPLLVTASQLAAGLGVLRGIVSPPGSGATDRGARG